MTDKNKQVWEVTYNNSIVRVENWWSIGGGKVKSEISLYVDDKLLGSSNENTVHPNKPILKASKVSDAIETIEVYVTGLFTVKVSILINGENVHIDKLNFFERILSKLLKR
jgi:hypothetical protein